MTAGLENGARNGANSAPERSQKRPSMRAAINAFCKGCLYDPGEPGNWRQQVGACAATDCPLFLLRPVSSGHGGQR